MRSIIMISNFLKFPVWVYLLFSLIANGEFLLGPHRLIPLHDVFDAWYIALKTNFQNLISSGGLVQWDPYSLGGNHALMRGFHPFNPFSLLSGFIPLWGVYSLWGFLMNFTAGYGMHLYLSRILKLTPASSYVGALLFLVASLSFPQSEVFNYAFPLFLVLFYQSFLESKTRILYFFILFFIILSSF